MTLQLDTTRLFDDAASAQDAAASAHSAPWLRRHLSAPALGIDVVAIVVAMLLSAAARQHLNVFEPRDLVVDSVLILGPVILGGWIASIGIAGGYQPEVLGAGTEEFKRTLNASLAAAGLVGVGCFLAKFPLSRAFYLITFGVGIVLVLTGRAGYRYLVHTLRRNGALTQRVLISGSAGHVDEVAAVLRREPWLGYEIVGAALPATSRAEQTMSGIAVFGTCYEAASLVKQVNADVLLLAGGACDSAGELRRTLWELEDESVQVIVAPGVSDVSRERVSVRPVGGLPLVHIDPPTWHDASRWGKRSFDLVGSMMLLIFLSPLLAFAAVWIKVHDGGPVIFKQVRIGRNGPEFSCLKFRSMVTDAEDHLSRLHEEQHYSGGLFKMRLDPGSPRLAAGYGGSRSMNFPS